ncbi:family 43 glycosylhydrolase [Thermostilla marina]
MRSLYAFWLWAVLWTFFGAGGNGLGQEIVDTWRFIDRQPPQTWKNPTFDDSRWAEGNGGFGTLETPGARVGTNWAGQEIWARKRFVLDKLPAKPALLMHHDEDAEVYINGKLVGEFPGFWKEYRVVPIEDPAVLVKGENVLAVHCRQTTGGQFIDVHVVDANHVPTLPEPKRSLKPFVSELITPWGEKVTPENAWREYPRPQLVRTDWTNLNGIWQYAITSDRQKAVPGEWDGEILVPFCLESKLGGVQRLLTPDEALWYRRPFTVKKTPGRRTLLNFEAVDYACEVYVNGKLVGAHKGGFTPFSFDITDAVVDGDNLLIVRVEDETEGWQLRGKQTLNPRGIWYTQVSGIWQTVWLEQVPDAYIADLKITTEAEKGVIRVAPITNHRTKDQRVEVVVKDGDKDVARAETDGALVELTVPDAKLWSPDSPHLYDLVVRLLDAHGNVVDQVRSYTGIRSVGKVKDENGHWRFTLNGKVIFHFGTLDQGWWPDGLLTPPSDEAIVADIQFLKNAGFNMMRKHIKVEPRRYYYHCDRLGLMVWQDHVSGGANPPWTRLKPDPVDADWPDAEHAQFMRELARMIDTLENHPSIVVWIPFNERWGQHRTMEVGEWVVQRDPTRLVNIASGGNFWPVGDVVDAHAYPQPRFPFEDGAGGRFDDFIKVVGEFGGHGYPFREHLWDANRRNWGYGGLPQTKDEYEQRYRTSIALLDELRKQGIAGGVYTQTTDVEGEINGLMTYDRKVKKMPEADLAAINRRLYEPLPETDSTKVQQRVTKTAVAKLPAVMSPEEIRRGLASHDRALYIKAGWIRDPYIVLGPDDYYYLTGTQPNPNNPREVIEPHNTGLGEGSIVGEYVRVWRSKDLIEWEYLGEPFSIADSLPAKVLGKKPDRRLIWAPELHWTGDRWTLVHCPSVVSTFALSAGPEIGGPWEYPLGENQPRMHDPSMFRDEDGTWYLLWGNTVIAPLAPDFSQLTAEPVRIDPAGYRIHPVTGEKINRIGHEGATMKKIGNKYVHFGTAWSTDQGRKGTYNLYYCTADKPTGPFGPRRFVGRFLGHGTPFQDRDGKWWCTAFFNANVPPLTPEEARSRDLSDNAYTINRQGVTIVPLEVRELVDGDVYIRAKDPNYATPGPEEVQKFDL